MFSQAPKIGYHHMVPPLALIYFLEQVVILAPPCLSHLGGGAACILLAPSQAILLGYLSCFYK